MVAVFRSLKRNALSIEETTLICPDSVEHKKGYGKGQKRRS